MNTNTPRKQYGKENEKRMFKNLIYYTASKLYLWRIFHTYQCPYILAYKTINIFLNQTEKLHSSDVKNWNIDSWNFTVILFFKKISCCHKKKKEIDSSPNDARRRNTFFWTTKKSLRLEMIDLILGVSFARRLHGRNRDKWRALRIKHGRRWE